MDFAYKVKIIPLFFAVTIGCAGAAPPAADAPIKNQAAASEAQAPGTIVHTGSAMLSPAEKDVLALSQQMWRWMSDRNTVALAMLYNDKVMFVHMSRMLTKSEELDVIKGFEVQWNAKPG